MDLYDIYLIGCKTYSEFNALKNAIIQFLSSAGVDQREVAIHDELDVDKKYCDGKRPAVIACFPDIGKINTGVIDEFLKRRVPIVPLRRESESFDEFPEKLRWHKGLNFSSNPDDCNLIAYTVLDAIGLLREQRRIFISYRQSESIEVAVQLFNHLSASGFEVFLDTHSIKHGVEIQDSLWHHLCDSDVVVMLDTPGYFESRWTVKEFGRALNSGIHILRLVWPNHNPTRLTELSEKIKLKDGDFVNRQLTKNQLKNVVEMSRILRARSIASRHTMLSGKLLASVDNCGGQVLGVGAFRAIRVSMPKKLHIWIYPVVGVPTSILMNNIAQHAEQVRHTKPFIIFDEFGISKTWLDHLEWLNQRVPEVDLTKVSDASDEIYRRIGET